MLHDQDSSTAGYSSYGLKTGVRDVDEATGDDAVAGSSGRRLQGLSKRGSSSRGADTGGVELRASTSASALLRSGDGEGMEILADAPRGAAVVPVTGGHEDRSHE